MGGTHLADFLAAAPADAVAMRDGDRTLSRGEIEAETIRAAAGLHALGVRPGDRVALWLPNVPAWLCLFFACARLGAIAVSVNTRFRAHEVADIVGRAGCRVLVLWPEFKAIDFAGILAAVDVGAVRSVEHVVVYGEPARVPATALIEGAVHHTYDALLSAPGTAPAVGKADSRCVIFTTSGTTKAPKFVCHDQGTVVQHARDVARALGLEREGTSVLQSLPLCGVFGFTQALAALAAVRPMRVQRVFDAVEAAALLRAEGITHMNGVDDMMDRMLAARAEPEPFPTLEHFGYAAFNPALEDIVERAATRGVRMRGLYGMSECHAFYALQPLELPLDERRKGGGRPVSPAARVRIRDPESGVLLGPGQHGEIEVSGPSLLHEYYDNAEATADALTADGFLRTGDLGYIEADGRFCYLARMGDVLRLGGFLVSPLEIESVIDSHPAVHSSQVVAVTFAGGSAPVAFVVPRDGECDAAAIIAHCKARLASFKVPRHVFAIDAFPTTLSANGTKIQKAKLRALAEARIAAGLEND